MFQERNTEHKHVSIDYYAYISGIRSWNPVYKVLFAVAALLVVIICSDPGVSLLTLIFMSGLTVWKGRIHWHDYMHLMLVPAAFIILGTIAILLQFGHTQEGIFNVPFFHMRMYITKYSLLQSGNTALKAFAAVSALYMMTLSTPMGEILSVFRRAHIPTVIIELMHLIYRYIFILSEIHHSQREAALSRMGYCDFKTALRTFGSELANLFVMSMKKAGSYYDAMEARGYEGECLFWEEPKSFSIRQAVYGAGYLVLVTVWIVWKMLL